jgi:hypothetical protein
MTEFCWPEGAASTNALKLKEGFNVADFYIHPQ